MLIKTQLWERKYGDFKDMPFIEKFVEENSLIEFDSVFEFKGDQVELFAFLYMAHKYGCTVKFKNEDLTITPDKETTNQILLTIYCLLYNQSKIVEDYNRWVYENYKQQQKDKIY